MADETPGSMLPSEIGRIIEDVGLLLEFLGQRADSRLQAHFDDTRGDLSAPIGKLAAPPCRTYRHFLGRFGAIQSRPCSSYARAAASAPATPAGSPPEGDEKLGDEAFLHFSRDFLAAVAAPATVDSIRMTRAYIAARRQPLWRLWRRNEPPAPASRREREASQSGRRLACRVAWTEWYALGGTILTLMISAYAFSGHRILDSQGQILAEWTAIGRDEAELAGEIPAAADLASPATLRSRCGAAATSRIAPKEAPPLITSVSADATVLGTAAYPSPAVIRLRECALYWRMHRNLENIAAVTLHMESWSRVVISNLEVGPITVGEVFGIDPASIWTSATEHPEFCRSLGLTEHAPNCAYKLLDNVFDAREVAESLLGAIALYILPTLYGGLGAMAATLRNLRSKVDLSLVTVTDRGRVRQDVILGVLCGAIIGLFFGYIGKAKPETGLGLSALALLAGYNASGVFAFLDELSNRFFQPGHGPSDLRSG